MGRVQNSLGSCFAVKIKFRFGFDRVCQFQQSMGSGLSGSSVKVRGLGFIRFGFEFTYSVNFEFIKINGKVCNLVQNWLEIPKK